MIEKRGAKKSSKSRRECLKGAVLTIIVLFIWYMIARNPEEVFAFLKECFMLF